MTCWLMFLALIYGGHEDAPKWVTTWAWVIVPILITLGFVELAYLDIPLIFNPLSEWAKND